MRGRALLCFGGNISICFKQLPVDDSFAAPLNTGHCVLSMEHRLWCWYLKFSVPKPLAPPCETYYIRGPFLVASSKVVELVEIPTEVKKFMHAPLSTGSW